MAEADLVAELLLQGRGQGLSSRALGRQEPVSSAAAPREPANSAVMGHNGNQDGLGGPPQQTH
jgi:hypothetical protein